MYFTFLLLLKAPFVISYIRRTSKQLQEWHCTNCEIGNKKKIPGKCGGPHIMLELNFGSKLCWQSCTILLTQSKQFRKCNKDWKMRNCCLCTPCITRSWNCCHNWKWSWSEKKKTWIWVHTLCDQPLDRL